MKHDIRALLSHMETDIYMWSDGHEEVSPRLLDQLLSALRKAITLDCAAADRKKLQSMIHQLERLQSALVRSEPVDRQLAQNLAQQIVEGVREIRHARTSILQPVAVEEVLGTQVIHFYYGLSTVGQVVRFQPASRDKRVFGFIGEVIIRPCDDQQAMKDLFQAIYPLRDGPVSDLYHWPADLPPQTFQEPGRAKDLVTIQWASHQGQNDDDEDEEEEEEATRLPEEIALVKTIKEGDRRIGTRVFSPVEEMRGYLVSIDVFADGFERWTVIGDDGTEMQDDSSLFWLESSQYRQLFPVRVLRLDDLSQKLRDALQLYEEKADLDDHDEIIQIQQRLDSIQKFLNGDLEDEQQRRITAIYQQMLWSSVSLNGSQHEEVARQTAIKIDRLRPKEE